MLLSLRRPLRLVMLLPLRRPLHLVMLLPLHFFPFAFIPYLPTTGTPESTNPSSAAGGVVANLSEG